MSEFTSRMVGGGCLFMALAFVLCGCIQSSEGPPPSPSVEVVEYPPIDWSRNGEMINDFGCEGDLRQSCPELHALGCDEIQGPGFYLGGLQPAYPVVECIHESDDPPDQVYFRQVPGLDQRYRSFAIYQEGIYRLLIKRSEFKAAFAPVESAEEALSYAMAMTSLAARNDLDAQAEIEYLVEKIEETHVVETPEGYLVYLFDGDQQMGCDQHPFYAVTALVTRAGEVQEVSREEVYRSYACFDFGRLRLEER